MSEENDSEQLKDLLWKERDALRAERDSLKEKLDDFLSVHGEYNSLTLELSDLGRKLTFAIKERDSLAAQLASLTDKFAEAAAKRDEHWVDDITEIEQQLAEAKREAAESIALVDGYQKFIEKQEQMLAAVKREAQSWKDAHGVASLDRDDAKRQNAELSVAIAVKDAALTHARSECPRWYAGTCGECANHVEVIGHKPDCMTGQIDAGLALKPADCLKEVREALKQSLRALEGWELLSQGNAQGQNRAIWTLESIPLVKSALRSIGEEPTP